MLFISHPKKTSLTCVCVFAWQINVTLHYNRSCHEYFRVDRKCVRKCVCGWQAFAVLCSLKKNKKNITEFTEILSSLRCDVKSVPGVDTKEKTKDTKVTHLVFQIFPLSRQRLHSTVYCLSAWCSFMFIYIHTVQRSAAGHWTTALHYSDALWALWLIINIRVVLLLQVFTFRSQVKSNVQSVKFHSRWDHILKF